MTNTETILELLEECHPKGFCDDCISNQSKIEPRQQVNQICRRLLEQNKLQRYKAECDLCHKSKIVNVLTLSSGASSANQIKEAHANYIITSTPTNQVLIDIEHIRTEVVRICYQLWKKQKLAEPPRSISYLINEMREEKLLPTHIANMMLTICGLRNVHVYENIMMGKRENTIASEAWAIISDWWNPLNR